ncbi:hypothetical protein R1A27_18165 [Methylobacterium sp. NMS12]|uniref:hypothetical protein n=1 Tax=Methylobacterium sp. NMS12 TaxID=3079766 RepID=UPI003F880991
MAFLARKARAYEAAGYAAGHRSNVEKFILHRHGIPQCDTDDGVLWLEDAIPFVVEEAEIRGYSAIIAGLKWGRTFCPLVSLNEVAEIVVEAIASRNEATKHYNETGRHMKWLPKGEDRKAVLLTRWDDVTTAGLKGMACIDPPSDDERRYRKTGQRMQQRRAKGMPAKETMNLMARRKKIADCFGVDVRTVQRWELKGAIPAARVQSMSPSCRDILQGDTDWTSMLPANDDQVVPEAVVTETITVEIVPANDDTPTPAPTTAPLTETGFTGRYTSMSPLEVQAALAQHPALQDDLRRHLDAIDEAMVKTPAENHRVVRRNLLKDQNLLAHRERRAREKAEAMAVSMSGFIGRNITLTADEVTELAASYRPLADRMHDHLADLEGPLSRVPPPNRKGALRRMVGARSKFVRSRQRLDHVAA